MKGFTSHIEQRF